MELQPAFVASLAMGVYAIAEHGPTEESLQVISKKYADSLGFSPHSLLGGISAGPAIVKCESAMGLCLLGKRHLRGHAVIVFRGTKYLADWLTNMNTSITRSAFNENVHDGFNDAFASMREQLCAFVATLATQKVASVHCVGHSLGGALATLCGEWLNARFGIKARVYTFGSPRVGLKGFSEGVTSRLGSDRIFRLWHKTDIVPYLPIWPFVHVPDEGGDYYLPSPGLLPSADFHFMSRYQLSVRDKSWASLRQVKPWKQSETGVLAWLTKDDPVAPTIGTLHRLDIAFIYVLKKCIPGAQKILSESLGLGATVIDRLAFALHRGITIASDASVWVLRLLKKILLFLGYGARVNLVEVSLRKIKSILMDFHQRLSMAANKVICTANLDGRAA